jgi:hypothetical protein
VTKYLQGLELMQSRRGVEAATVKDKMNGEGRDGEVQGWFA